MESTAVDDKVWPEFDVSKGRDFDMTMWGWSAPVMLNGGSLAALCSSDYAIGNDNIGGYKMMNLINWYPIINPPQQLKKQMKLQKKCRNLLQMSIHSLHCIMTIICMHVIQACMMVG